MGSRYTTTSASGFDSSPPSDDGTQTAANLVTWAGIKTKLATPVKDLADSVNTKLLTAFDYSVRQITGSDSVAASDHMRTVEIAPTVSTSVSVTLADAATMTSNFIVRIRNSSTIAQSITRATSGDTIDGVAGVISIPAKSSAIYTVNAAANGYLTLAQSAPTGDFPAGLTSAQTLTNKTLTSPVINTGVTGTAIADASAMAAGTSSSLIVTPAANRLILGTEQATTSGTSIDFTGIPAGTRRITIMFVGVSTNGTSVPIVQLGDSGGIETSGYLGGAAGITTAVSNATNQTTGFSTSTSSASASQALHGAMTLILENASSFTWVETFVGYDSNQPFAVYGAGRKSLSAELTQVRLTTVNGTDAFDAGAVNITYER